MRKPIPPPDRIFGKATPPPELQTGGVRGPNGTLTVTLQEDGYYHLRQTDGPKWIESHLTREDLEQLGNDLLHLARPPMCLYLPIAHGGWKDD
jgi:hypothetical protein